MRALRLVESMLSVSALSSRSPKFRATHACTACIVIASGDVMVKDETAYIETSCYCRQRTVLGCPQCLLLHSRYD